MEEEEKLNVYGETKNILIYAACGLLSPRYQRLERVLGKYDGVKVWLNEVLLYSSLRNGCRELERLFDGAW